MEGGYNVTFSLIDKGLLEFAGPTGLGRQTILLGRLLARAQTGRVYDYAGFMLLFLCLALVLINTGDFTANSVSSGTAGYCLALFCLPPVQPQMKTASSKGAR